MSQIYCLRIDFASCLGFYTRTLLAKLCSVFKVLPLSCFLYSRQLLYFIKPSFLCQELFWFVFLSCSSFFCFRLTTFKYITSLFTSLQVLFSFYLFSFLTCLFLSSRRISRSDFINLPYFLRFGKSCSSFGFYVFLWNIYSDCSNYISRICFQL